MFVSLTTRSKKEYTSSKQYASNAENEVTSLQQLKTTHNHEYQYRVEILVFILVTAKSYVPRYL